MKDNSSILRIPCLRGRMGDWFYYSSVLSFKEVKKRVKLPKEINKKYSRNKELKLGEWIQRDLDKTRTSPIVKYLQKTDQRFFNSLVLGIYDGSPKWQELNITFDDNEEKIFQPDELDYFSRTFGVLTLSGKESLFAIDGQHRALAIRNAYEADEELFINDEISIILVAHKSSLEGKERTRRLFSTLNRYAKPVKTNEIIALSEDDNAAIITRKLIDEYRLIENRIKISKQKTINDSDDWHFTTIIQLYEFIKSLLTQKKFSTYPKEKSTKREAKEYLHYRESEEVILKDYKYVKNILDKLIKNIIPLKEILIENKTLDRKLKSTSILFRPIGQNILFDLVCIALNEKRLSSVISFFNESTFTLTHHVWQKVFINSETKGLKTDKYLQRYAKILIQEKLSISVKMTKKDTEIYENFGFNKGDI